MSHKNLLALYTSVIMLSGCSGGGDSDPPQSTVTPSIGVFVDSAVAGLHYETPTYTGTTNSAGEYEYQPGERVTFSIGGIVLGSSVAGPVITPLSLVPGASDATHPVVTNIVRLLLTMDEDGNPDNGISLSAAAVTASANQSVDFNASDFAADPGMSDLLAALPGSPTLVDAAAAQSHFSATLASQSIWGSLSWGSGTWKSKTL